MVARTMRTYFSAESAHFVHEVDRAAHSNKQHWFFRMLCDGNVPNVCSGLYIQLWKLYIGQLGRYIFKNSIFRLTAINTFWEDFCNYVEEDVNEHGVLISQDLRNVRVCLGYRLSCGTSYIKN